MDVNALGSRIGRSIERQSVAVVQVTAVCLTLVLGVLDYLSGPQLAFSIFYLVPVSLVAWRIGSAASVVTAVFAAAVWLVADLFADQPYAEWWYPLWNTATRFAVFALIGGLLVNLRSAMRVQERMAETDFLTGVCNGRAFAKKLSEEVERVTRSRRPFTVAYIDLDDFKSVNDVLGHAGGDAVLTQVGATLSANTRADDTVGRLGGDEFSVLLPGADPAAARSVAEMLSRRIAIAFSDFAFPVTFSFGVATFTSPPADVDEVIHAADELMYAAKRSGKNTFRHRVFGSGELDAPAPKRIVLAEESPVAGR